MLSKFSQGRQLLIKLALSQKLPSDPFLIIKKQQRLFCAENPSTFLSKDNFNPNNTDIPYPCKASTALKTISSNYSEVCKITETNTYPLLERVPEKLLVENWWAQRPFAMNKPLQVPIMSFSTGEFSGKVVE